MCSDDDVKFAMEFSRRIHRGQKDKGGNEYWKHPQAVADMVSTNDEKAAALLHDSVEDTCVSIDVIKLLFGNEIAEAVDYLTHPEGMDYMDQIKRLAVNDIARNVKMADLKNNMDLKRLPNVTEYDIARTEKYKKAYEYLKNYERSASGE